MQTLEINVPEKKFQLVVALLKELGVSIKDKRSSDLPNKETITAMEELKAGKGVAFDSVDEMFNIIK